MPPEELAVDWVPVRGSFPILSSAKDLLQKISGDVIYAIKPKPTSFGMALLQKLRTSRPVVLDIDDWELSWLGGDEWRYRPSFKQLLRDIFKTGGALRHSDHPLYLRWMEKLVSHANAVTVDTSFLKHRFGGIYLPNGKDTALFDPQKFDPEVSRARHGLSDYRVLMFPGTARPHKGLEDLLRALDLLNEPDLRLVIVGGRKPDNYEDQLLARWQRWVIKLPRLPLEAMPEVVSAAHVIVVPQRDLPIARAQLPLKLTEGMAMAKPVLSTRVGDIPAVLGDTGYLVDPSSPEQLADQIQWIFQHLDQANAQGLRARERCVRHFNTDAMADILSNTLSRL